MNGNQYNIADFTIENYRRLLRISQKSHHFLRYDDIKKKSSLTNILWRHDVDISMHRAVKLAAIEHEEGIFSTYFLHLQSQFYNLLEPEITQFVLKIISFGHQIGLHFDVADRKINSPDDLKKYLKQDRGILESLYGVKIKTFSFHNPTLLPFPVPENFKIDGMINTYSAYLKKNFEYCSDSNGYWRFKRLEDLLTSTELRSLQILTHPEWWTDTAMMPRQRIQRCIDGRAKKTASDYDKILLNSGRENVS